MNEVRYHPIVSDEGEMVPLFFTNDKRAVSQNDYYLEEIVPHYYRLISKTAMPERTVRSFRIRCPVCGSRLKPIASGVDAHKHALCRCFDCEQQNHIYGGKNYV